jgi:hypothetical protein
MVSLLAAFATTVVAVIVHRRRGLWVALSALPALFWPTVTVTLGIHCAFMIVTSEQSDAGTTERGPGEWTAKPSPLSFPVP